MIIDNALVLDTLVVESGASIFFNQGTSIRVTNFLSIEGKSGAEAVFASAEQTPSPFDWTGIIIDSGASAIVLNARFSHCAECITCQTDRFIIDSTKFENFGQHRVKMNGFTLASLNTDYFSYNADKRFAPTVPSDNGTVTAHVKRNWKIYLGGIAAIGIGVPIAILASGSPGDGSNPVPEESTDIKHPNLPPLQE